MDTVMILLVGLFLPIFPLSMVFNLLMEKMPGAIPRSILLLVWPQIGVFLLGQTDLAGLAWSEAAQNQALVASLSVLSVGTAFLYAFRTLAMRELQVWIGYVATASWGLLWIVVFAGLPLTQLQLFALGFSVPLLMLNMLAGGLVQRYGAAYTGLYQGLALSIPRFAGVFVAVLLTAMATPVAPGFFIFVFLVMALAPDHLILAGMLFLVWLMLNWAGIRVIQGLMVGDEDPDPPEDMSLAGTWAYSLVLAVVVLSGLTLLGGQL